MHDLKSELQFHLPIIILDRYFPHKLRRNIVKTLLTLGIIILLLGIVYAVINSFLPEVAETLPGSVNVFIGIFLIVLGPFISLLFLSFFYNTRYFHGIDAIVHEGIKKENGISLEVARIITMSSSDITLGFLSTPYGQFCMARCGLEDNDVSEYLLSKRTILSETAIVLPEDRFFTLEDLTNYILNLDTSFRDFLFSHGVTDEVFKGAVSWIMSTYH